MRTCRVKPIFYSLCMLCMLTSTQVMAVDGYKDLKFGMTMQQVAESSLCTFVEIRSPTESLEALGCTNLKFGGVLVGANALFVEGRFLRFVIVPETESMKSLVNALQNKFGPPSSRSTNEEFEAFSQFPNRSAFISFDNGTVLIQIKSDALMNESLLLIYSSPEYEPSLVRAQQKTLEDDV